MSTAWYRPGFVPKLIRQWKSSSSSHSSSSTVEVWEATCIVTNFSKTGANCDILINPANPNLSGVSLFPYFPRGGPEPQQMPSKDSHPIMGYVTQWGGMEVGNGMMFAANVVDGLVHQLGGKALAAECRDALQTHKVSKKCDEGTSMYTKLSYPSGSDHGLKEQFPKGIIHTVPPFYSEKCGDDGDKEQNQQQFALLESCYETSFRLIRETPSLLSTTTTTTTTTTPLRVACPLLGAGCRGFPTDQAIEAAANAAANHLLLRNNNKTENETDDSNTSSMAVAFAIPNGEIRNTLIERIDESVSSKQ